MTPGFQIYPLGGGEVGGTSQGCRHILLGQNYMKMEKLRPRQSANAHAFSFISHFQKLIMLNVYRILGVRTRNHKKIVDHIDNQSACTDNSDDVNTLSDDDQSEESIKSDEMQSTYAIDELDQPVKIKKMEFGINKFQQSISR